MKKPKNIEQAIAGGLESVTKYINSSQLSDRDLLVLRKYISVIEKADSETLTEAVKLNQLALVSRLIGGKVNPGEMSIAVLVMAANTLSKTPSSEKCLAILENTLIELANRYKVQSNARLSTLISETICRCVTAKTLARMPHNVQVIFSTRKNFGDLSNPEKFDEFYAIQTAGIFNKARVSLSNFMPAFKLWESRRDEIKNAFLFFDHEIICAALDRDPSRSSQMLECFDHYIRNSIAKKNYVWPFANKKNPELLAVYERELKADLLQVCEAKNLPELARIVEGSLTPAKKPAGRMKA